jgi:hypothetical protein
MSATLKTEGGSEGREEERKGWIGGRMKKRRDERVMEPLNEWVE